MFQEWNLASARKLFIYSLYRVSRNCLAKKLHVGSDTLHKHLHQQVLTSCASKEIFIYTMVVMAYKHLKMYKIYTK
jgi:hypothetical protein